MSGAPYEALLALVPQGGARVDWAGLGAAGLGDIFAAMQSTQQNPEYHAEGDVLTHTKLVTEALVNDPRYAAESDEGRTVLFLAALLHDVGKPKCTRLRDGKLTSPYHTSTGARVARELLFRVLGLAGTPEAVRLRESVLAYVRYHSFPPFAIHATDVRRRLLRIAAMGELAGAFTIERLCILEDADIRGRISPNIEEALERVEYCRMLAEEEGVLRSPFSFTDAFSERAYFRGQTDAPTVPLYRDSFGTVIMMSGLPGTGKDTYIAANYPDLPVVSLDAIRARLSVRPTDNQGPVVAAAIEEAREHLRKKQPFVWNATCLTAEFRGQQISLFEQYGASVRTVFLETEYREGLRRNAGREGVAVVPVPVIDKMIRNMELPERHECEEVVWLQV